MSVVDSVPSVETIRSAVADHLLAALDRTSVENRPFSHCYIEDAFPPAVYETMLAALPPDEHYYPDNPRKYGRPDGLNARNILDLDNASIGRLPEPLRSLWFGVAEALRSPALKDKLFDMLATDLCRRFRVSRSMLRTLRCDTRSSLVRDLGGYRIEPHPDSQTKIVTLQFYLARDLSHLDVGTALYRPSVKALVTRGRVFAKVKQFPFRPNTGYAFAVGRRSWHGCERVPDGCGTRDTLLQFFYRENAKK